MVYFIVFILLNQELLVSSSKQQGNHKTVQACAFYTQQYQVLQPRDDIVIGLKNINAAIGRIEYIGSDDRPHFYFPDFYIKSTNTIIEVKSQWTFDLHKDKNIRKQNACISLGFSFIFRII